MKTTRLLCLAALAAALPLTALGQAKETGKDPVVNLKPPPGSATPQAEGHAGPDGAASGAMAKPSKDSMNKEAGKHDPATGKPPVVDLKPPPGSATPQAK